MAELDTTALIDELAEQSARIDAIERRQRSFLTHWALGSLIEWFLDLIVAALWGTYRLIIFLFAFGPSVVFLFAFGILCIYLSLGADFLLGIIKPLAGGIITAINIVGITPINAVLDAWDAIQGLNILGIHPFGWLPYATPFSFITNPPQGSEWDWLRELETIAELCPRFANFSYEFGFGMKMLLSSGLCPHLRYVYPVPALYAVADGLLGWASFTPVPGPDSCQPVQYGEVCFWINIGFLLGGLVIIVLWGIVIFAYSKLLKLLLHAAVQILKLPFHLAVWLFHWCHHHHAVQMGVAHLRTTLLASARYMGHHGTEHRDQSFPELHAKLLGTPPPVPSFGPHIDHILHAHAA